MQQARWKWEKKELPYAKNSGIFKGKDAGFDVTDKIKVYQKDNDKIKEIMEKNAEEINKLLQQALSHFKDFKLTKKIKNAKQTQGSDINIKIKKYK